MKTYEELVGEEKKPEPMEELDSKVSKISKQLSDMMIKVDSISKRLSAVEEKAIPDVKSIMTECPDCGDLVKPVDFSKHWLTYHKPKPEVKTEVKEVVKEVRVPIKTDEFRSSVLEYYKGKLTPDQAKTRGEVLGEVEEILRSKKWLE